MIFVYISSFIVTVIKTNQHKQLGKKSPRRDSQIKGKESSDKFTHAYGITESRKLTLLPISTMGDDFFDS
jgi:hypothetical protein